MTAKHKIATSSDDGRPLAVLRPAKPDVAMALVKAALSSGNPSLFEEGLPEKECGPYTFVGWLASTPGGILVDGEGNEVGHTQAGDSFVTLEDPKN